jgi:hypothetical protein
VQATSLHLLTSIGYGPTHVSCECRVLVALRFGGGLGVFKVHKDSFGALEVHAS